MGYENLPEDLGYLVGSLSGPLAPAERYRKEQAQQEYLRSSVPAGGDKGRGRFLSLSQKYFNEHQSLQVSHVCEQRNN